MHYNYQSEEDLKKIYDKVMNSNMIESRDTVIVNTYTIDMSHSYQV